MAAVVLGELLLALCIKARCNNQTTKFDRAKIVRATSTFDAMCRGVLHTVACDGSVGIASCHAAPPCCCARSLIITIAASQHQAMSSDSAGGGCERFF